MKRLILSVIFVSVFITQGYCLEKENYTLENLLENSLQNREYILSQEAKIKSAQEKVKEAFSHYFPKIKMTAAYTKTLEETTIDLSDYNINTTSTVVIMGAPVQIPVSLTLPDEIDLFDDRYGTLSVTLDQPIFTWKRITNYVNAAKKLEEFETIQKRGIENEIRYQVRKAYYSFLAAKEARKFFERSHQEIRLIHKLMQKMMKSETTEESLKPNRLELMEVEGFILFSEGLKEEAKSMEKTALNYLSFASGFEKTLNPSDIAGRIDINFPLKSKEEYISRAFLNNTDIQSLGIGIKAENNLYKAERASMLPGLYLNLFYQKFTDMDIIEPDDSYGGSIVLQGPIFDFGEIKAKSNQHLFKKKSLIHKEKYAKKVVETYISALYDEIASRRTKINNDKKALVILEKRLRLAVFGIKNKMTSYREYKEGLMTRNMVTEEYFKSMKEYYDKVCLLIKLVGIESL